MASWMLRSKINKDELSEELAVEYTKLAVATSKFTVINKPNSFCCITKPNRASLLERVTEMKNLTSNFAAS